MVEIAQTRRAVALLVPPAGVLVPLRGEIRG